MDELELKPCPFCRGKAYVLESSYAPIWTIHCGTYDCIAYIGGKHYDSREKAIAAWNSRADYTNELRALNSVLGKLVRKDSENSALRELIVCMYQTIKGMNLQPGIDWLPCTRSCPYWKNGVCVELPDEECWYEVRMRDLGIEVQG